MKHISLISLASALLIALLVAVTFPSHQGKTKEKRVISTKETFALEGEDTSVVLLDVRTAEEYDSGTGHLKGAILIPVQELEQRAGELEKYRDKTIITYCRTGRRSEKATGLLTKKGFKVFNMEGGIVKWNEEKLPVEKEKGRE